MKALMNKFDQLHSLCRRDSGPRCWMPSIRGAVAKLISPPALRPFGAYVRKRSALLQGPNDTFGVQERNHDGRTEPTCLIGPQNLRNLTRSAFRRQMLV
jgi:hypothetical protein